MNFLEFYSSHFVGLTLVIFLLVALLLVGVFFICKKILKENKKLKTPWFEIAPDSVKTAETEDMGKTRLLLKRQMEFVDNYIKGTEPIFLMLTKKVVTESLKNLLLDDITLKTHMISCFTQSETNTLMEILKSYINNLLVMNHIGTNKEKIESYAKNHVSQLAGITKQFYCECYNKLSGDVCVDTLQYWKEINIEPMGWTYDRLLEILIGVAELRYSDFNK